MKTLRIIEHEENSPVFVKTARAVNYVGLVLMWFCVALSCAVFLSKSFWLGAICLFVEWLVFSALQIGQRRGVLTENIVVLGGHPVRLAIIPMTIALAIAGGIHLWSYGEPIVVVVVMAVAAASTTLWRFVGVKK